MDYATLKNEIQTDPATLGYAALMSANNDQGIADLLNTVNRTVVQSTMITTRSLMDLLGPAEADAILTALEAAAASDSIVKRALAFLQPAEGGIDMGSAATRAQIDALASASVLSGDQAAQLKGLAEVMVSRAAEIGLPHIEAGDVATARVY